MPDTIYDLLQARRRLARLNIACAVMRGMLKGAEQENTERIHAIGFKEDHQSVSTHRFGDRVPILTEDATADRIFEEFIWNAAGSFHDEKHLIRIVRKNWRKWWGATRPGKKSIKQSCYEAIEQRYKPGGGLPPRHRRGRWVFCWP